MHHIEKVLERLARQGQGNVPALGLRHRGELGRRQRLQGESALGRLDGQLTPGGRQADITRIGQRTQDVDQFARRDRQRLVILADAKIRMRRDLHFKIGRDERDGRPLLAQEDIGQDRQGMSPFDNPGHRGQGFEQRIARGLDELHGLAL